MSKLNYFLALSFSLALLSGCGDRNDAASERADSDPGPASEEAEMVEADPIWMMGDGSWRVRDLGYLPVITNSTITIERFEPGRIAGLAGCNRYNASVVTDANGIRITPPAATLMACPDEELAEQEQRFLEALTKVESVEIAHDGQLIMRLSSGGAIRARQYLVE
ncbi:MAG: META domain-containing protein [Wenzhouxiangella sp.]